VQNAPAVETTRLCKSYGDVHALRGVDLRVEASSLVLGLVFSHSDGAA
jgi:ABC-type sugar transport system ATPase subunit